MAQSSAFWHTISSAWCNLCCLCDAMTCSIILMMHTIDFRRVVMTCFIILMMHTIYFWRVATSQPSTFWHTISITWWILCYTSFFISLLSFIFYYFFTTKRRYQRRMNHFCRSINFSIYMENGFYFLGYDPESQESHYASIGDAAAFGQLFPFCELLLLDPKPRINIHRSSWKHICSY